jgi:copper chaperone CopZ
MEPYRWWFIGGALLLLGFAGFREYRVSKEPDCDCEDGVSPKARRTLLLVAALVTLGAAASPELLAPAGPQEVAASNQLHRVVLAVEGMTCPTCTLTVEKALGDLEGAVVVGVTYEPPHATVDLDPARWNASDAIASIEAVGYTAQLVWEENDGDE